MTSNYRIGRAAEADELEIIAELFRAYAASLPVDLAYQDFAGELARLPGSYASPRGALLLARSDDGEPLGCVALRGLSDEVCEMKRLFIVPQGRGTGLGRALTMAVIEEAKRIGYSELRLDTLPTMEAAQALYRRLGFALIPAYYEPTPAGTAFMALRL